MTIDLTTVGTIDWAHWGYAVASDFDHRLSGGEIPNVTEIGGASVARFGAFATGFSWTDGTPHTTANNVTSGILVRGVGNGFALDVPADGSLRVVSLFASNYYCTGHFTAHLSDGSVANFVDDLVDAGTGSYRQYIVRYRASPGTYLQLTWAVASAIDATGNVSLEAATLSNP